MYTIVLMCIYIHIVYIIISVYIHTHTVHNTSLHTHTSQVGKEQLVSLQKAVTQRIARAEALLHAHRKPQIPYPQIPHLPKSQIPNPKSQIPNPNPSTSKPYICIYVYIHK